MKKEYALLESENYKLIVSLEEIDFDYYTDVCIELIFDKKPIILFKDNLLALKNIVEQYENVDILDDNLNENKLGILLNNYYRGFYENQFDDNLIFDNQERWIGEKYCCFSSLEYVTWIYKYDGNIIMKVTPVFRGFEKDDFVQEYNDIFREVLSLQQLLCIKEVVIELYNKLF